MERLILSLGFSDVSVILLFLNQRFPISQGVTKRCPLSWLTKSALLYEPRGCGVSANEYSCAHGAQVNFGDLTPYFTCAIFLCRWSHFYARWVWKFYLKREDYGDEEKRYLLR